MGKIFERVRTAVRHAVGAEPRPLMLPAAAAPELMLQHALSAGHGPSARYAKQWDGEKFPGGMFDSGGLGHHDWTDYHTLRARSEDVFKRNLYAKGLIRRLITNEIHTGLALEAIPVESVLGVPDESLQDWTDEVEKLFELWGKTADVCDHTRRMTFGKLQALVRLEALIGGDCLNVMRSDPDTKLPTIEVIKASRIGGTSDGVADGNRVWHGVEVDPSGRHVAFHVFIETGRGQEVTRIPAFDEDGRRRAWMVYGTEMRANSTRGEPLLGVVLQSLKEIDKYRDSAQRKAVINSMLALFMRKTQDKMGSQALTGAATRLSTNLADPGDADSRSWSLMDQVPGIVIEELQTGEEPVGFDNRGIDTAFPEFEAAVLSAIAWANEIPPEILTLSFSSNYSASQAALNEFRMYLELRRVDMGDSFLSVVYREWLIDSVLRGDVQAPSLRLAIGSRADFQTVAAWTLADWSGAVKPNADPLKANRALEEACTSGFMSRQYATRLATGRNYRREVRQLKRDNEMLAEALKPLAPVMPEMAAALVEVVDEDVDVDGERTDGEDTDTDTEEETEDDDTLAA